MPSRVDEIMRRYGTPMAAGNSANPSPLDARVPMRPIAPAMPTGGSRLDEVMNRYGVQFGATQAPVEEESNAAVRFVNQLPEPFRVAAGGALRGLASSLEPLQLSQDVLFATLAGALDPKTTITDRLKTINFGDYLPGGAAPPRPANGEEIFSLMGFNETTSRWAGIAADLLVDPLVFGSWLRVAGKLGKIDDLVRLGDRVDNFISPIGMGREVNKVLRRSSTISDFQDARTEALMSVFRNPNSTVLGIKRFGERSTNALSYVMTPVAVDRLRFGDEAATALGAARRKAKEEGLRFNQEALDMLYNAQRGPLGERSTVVVRDYLKAMEGQSEAYRRHLIDLDPTVRDVIEREVYNAVRPDPKTGEGGIGFLAFIGGRRGLDNIDDIDLRVLGEETYEATARNLAAQPVRTKVTPPDDDIFGSRMRSIQRDILDPARHHVGDVARERAATAGKLGQELDDAEAAAVRVFNGYLKDTVHIDAKLGMITSGYDFVGGQVRSRTFELIGDMNAADEVWYRVLRAGLRNGQKGVEELKGAETRFSLRSLLPKAPRTTEDAVVQRTAYRNAVAAEVSMMTGADGVAAREVAASVVRDVAAAGDETSKIWSTLYARERIPAMMLPDPQQTAALQRAQAATRDAAEGLEKATERIEQMRRVMPTGSKPKDIDRMLGGAVRARDAAENRLTLALRNEQKLLSEARSLSGGERPIRTAAARGAATRQSAMGRIGSMMGEVEEAQRRLQRAQFSRKQEIERIVAARQRAADAVGVGPQAVVANEAADIGAVPLAGKNPVAEDILAARMATGMTLEQAVQRPVTYGEILDGISDMQALPIGEFLGGLMNGHLRRAYALFGDSDDFKRYIDHLRNGSIIPSSVIDESELVKNMVGYEREAELIMEYQKAMTRAGRGMVMRKTAIAEHLLRSKVPPERVNGALRAMAQALGPDNGRLKDFLTQMDQMVPQYQDLVRQFQNSRRAAPDQPVLVNTRFFDPTEKLDRGTLERLGEIAMATASIGESAEIAKRVGTRQELFQNIYQVARTRGMLRNAPYTDEFGAVYVKYADSENIMGGFGGKWIHPHLYEELRRAAAVEHKSMPNALTRVRALVTGGYLASPAVIAANFFGGIYQSATAGINPVTTVRRLFEVLPDMNAASKGYRDNLVGELRRYVDVDLTSLAHNDFTAELRKVRFDDFGLGPEGASKVFDQVTRAMEGFLQRPGIGRVRTRFAGLEGFQFTENWFKVAAYKEMKERLTGRLGRVPTGSEAISIEKQAAEFARLVVFDYSELPKGLEMLKNSGLVLFPGFTYFLAGRTMTAVMNRPGTLAVADRISEAMANATLSLEDQLVLLAGTPEWMRQDQGVPVPFSKRPDAMGDERVSVLPLNQLVPTSTILDFNGRANPWAESVSSLGVWGPLWEVFRALTTGDGEAALSAQYGNRVFDADSEGTRKAADVFRFLYNTMAPGVVKKMLTVNYDNQLQGFAPAVPDMFRALAHPGSLEMASAAYSFDERRSARPDRTWREATMSMFLRSPQVVALDGPLSGIGRELRSEQARLGEQLNMLRRRAQRAESEGDAESYERWAAEIRDRRDEFTAKWDEYIRFYEAYQIRKAQGNR
jgi:hypothetical protein